MRKFIIISTLVYCAVLSYSQLPKSEFLIGVWCPPPANESMNYYQDLISEGYNMGDITDMDYDSINRFNFTLQFNLFDNLDSLNSLTMNQNRPIYSRFFAKNYINPSKLLSIDSTITKQRFNTILDSLLYKNKEWFHSYVVYDEPNKRVFKSLRKLVDLINAKDTTHIQLINLHPCYATYEQITGDSTLYNRHDTVSYWFYDQYVKKAVDTLKLKLLSYDNYIFREIPNSSSLVPYYFRNMEIIRKNALENRIPFHVINQSCSIANAHYLLPNYNQLRWQANTTLVYGGKGINWFLYFNIENYNGVYTYDPAEQDSAITKNHVLADNLKKVNHELRAIGNEMMSYTSTGVYHTGEILDDSLRTIPNTCYIQVDTNDVILGTFEIDNSPDSAFMIVNRDYSSSQSRDITVNFDYGPGILRKYCIIESYENGLLIDATGRWEIVSIIGSNDSISIELDPGESALFKLTEINDETIFLNGLQDSNLNSCAVAKNVICEPTFSIGSNTSYCILASNYVQFDAGVFVSGSDINFTVTMFNNEDCLCDSIELSQGASSIVSNIDLSNDELIDQHNNEIILGDNLQNILISPNPVNDLLMITIPHKVDSKIRFGIIDAYGTIRKMIHYERYDATEERINVSELPIGVYILVVEFNNQVETIRFIKQ